MGLIDKIVGFYEDIRELNSSNIQDFRGKMKSWLKMGMLAGDIEFDTGTVWKVRLQRVIAPYGKLGSRY